MVFTLEKNEEEEKNKALIGGIIGTAVMTILMMISPMMGFPKMCRQETLSMMMGFPIVVGRI